MSLYVSGKIGPAFARYPETDDMMGFRISVYDTETEMVFRSEYDSYKTYPNTGVVRNEILSSLVSKVESDVVQVRAAKFLKESLAY